MALPVVEANSGFESEEDTADNILTLTKPTGTVSGDILVALLGKDEVDSSYAAGLPAGWTIDIPKITSGSGTTGIQLSVAWKLAGGSEPATYDFTSSTADGSVLGGGIIRISGAHTTDPFHIKTGTATGSSTSIDCPDITTTVNDCLILRLMMADDNDYTDNSTPGGGHTILWAESTSLGLDMASGAAHIDLATAGSPGAASFTGLASTEQWCAVTIAIQPPAGGATHPGWMSDGGWF